MSENDQRGLMRSCHNPNAERSVIGAALLDTAIVSWIRLEPEEFFDPRHRSIWVAMRALHEAGTAIDVVTLEAELTRRGRLESVGGVAYIGELAGFVPTASNVSAYAELMRDAYDRLCVQKATADAQGSISRGTEDTDEIVAALLRQLGKITDRTKNRITTAGAAVREEGRAIWEAVERRARGEEVWVGVPTGIRKLDESCGGLPIGILALLGGRPSEGKSTIALRMLRNMTDDRNTSAIKVSWEDAPDTDARRLISSESRVDYRRIRSRDLARDDTRAILPAITEEAKRDNLILVNATGLTMAQTIRILRQLAAEAEREGRPVRCIVLDYVQNIPSPEAGMQRTYGIEQNLAMFEALIHKSDLACAGLALSQLKRHEEPRGGRQEEPRRPGLNDFKDSGSLEQKGKLILALHSDSKMHREDQAELLILKDHEGPARVRIMLHFERRFATISDAEISQNDDDDFPA